MDGKFGLFLVLVCVACMEAKPKKDEKFYMTPDFFLMLMKSDEILIEKCQEPGLLVTVRYKQLGQWMEDYGRKNCEGKSRLPRGGYYKDGIYFETNEPWLGDDTPPLFTTFEELDVPFNRDFRFIGKVGEMEIPPFTASFEAWQLTLPYPVCGVGSVDSCIPLESAQSDYNNIVRFHKEHTVVPILGDTQGDANLLELSYSYKASSGNLESRTVKIQSEIDISKLRIHD